MTTTLILEPPCAFINANDRLHHHAKAPLTKAWRTAAKGAVDGEWIPEFYDRCHITVTIRFANNVRRDVGNYYPTAKAIVDGLVDSQLLVADDSDEFVVGPDLRRERPNGTPRVTVTIEEIQ